MLLDWMDDSAILPLNATAPLDPRQVCCRVWSTSPWPHRAGLTVSCAPFPQDRLEASMSDTSPFGFERFVPGFDFLQNLAKGAAGGVSSMPGLGNWIAPTMQVEDLQKRIDELKAVQFWLDQNSRALTATVQALEV